MKIYSSYMFVNKDPVIDEMRPLVKHSKKSYKTLSEDSGVSIGTINGWFNGKTRRPQSASIEAVGRALGYKRKWVKDRKN